MLYVTSKATRYLSLLLERSEAEGSQGVRLLPSSSGSLSLVLDEPQEEDLVVTDDDRAVLLVDPEVAKVMDGALLDAIESPQGDVLVLALLE